MSEESFDLRIHLADGRSLIIADVRNAGPTDGGAFHATSKDGMAVVVAHGQWLLTETLRKPEAPK